MARKQAFHALQSQQISELIRHLVLPGLPLDCLLCMKGAGLGPPNCCTVSEHGGMKPTGHTIWRSLSPTVHQIRNAFLWKIYFFVLLLLALFYQKIVCETKWKSLCLIWCTYKCKRAEKGAPNIGVKQTWKECVSWAWIFLNEVWC